MTAPLREGPRGREYDGLPADTVEMLAMTAQAHSERTALVDARETLTWAAVRDEVEALAGRLVGAGTGRGDRVALLFGNGVPFVVALWAVWRVGAVAVPLNHRQRTHELVPLLRDAKPSLLLVGRGREELGQALSEQAGIRASHEVDGRSLSEQSSQPVPPHSAAANEVAALMYTSGTTGEPKGVVITHRNLVQTGGTCTLVLGRRTDDVELVMVPQFNITGLAAQTVPVVLAGMTAVLLDGFDPAEVRRLVALHRVTVTVGAPTMWWRVLEHGDGHAGPVPELASLRLAAYGGAPMPAALLSRMRDALPQAAFGNGYGMTETCSMVTYLGGEEALVRPHTVGAPLPITDVRVVHPGSADEVAPGDVGELLVRGPQVALGYWSDGEVVPSVDEDGWYRTGDAARIEDGHLVLQDRLKDVIKRGGESIYSFDVEEVLNAHPAVREVAVVGVPDPVYGERVMAHVVLHPGAASTEDELRSFCRVRAASYKTPSFIAFHTELPRNAGGKVLKAQLRRSPVPDP